MRTFALTPKHPVPPTNANPFLHSPLRRLHDCQRDRVDDVIDQRTTGKVVYRAFQTLKHSSRKLLKSRLPICRLCFSVRKVGFFGALIRSGLQPTLSFVPLLVAHM